MLRWAQQPNQIVEPDTTYDAFGNKVLTVDAMGNGTWYLHDKLNRLIEAGPFEVHVARTFPLDQAAGGAPGAR